MFTADTGVTVTGATPATSTAGNGTTTDVGGAVVLFVTGFTSDTEGVDKGAAVELFIVSVTELVMLTTLSDI